MLLAAAEHTIRNGISHGNMLLAAAEHAIEFVQHAMKFQPESWT